MSDNLWSFKQMQQFYSDYAKDYDKDISVETYPAPFVIGSWIVQHVHSAMSNHQNLPERCIRVLDLGCGTGRSSAPLFEYNQSLFHVDGLDGCQEMLDKAAKLPFHSLAVTDIESDAWSTANGNVASIGYDIILCIGVLDFVKDPVALLQKAKSLLSIRSKSSQDNTPLLKPRFGLTLPQGGDMNSFSRQQMEDMIAKCGFFVERHEVFMGYQDSATGEQVHYHGYLLSVGDLAQ